MLTKVLVTAIWWWGALHIALIAASCGQGSKRGFGLQQPAPKPVDGVCGPMDIRNSVENFQKLENCTVVEGKLHILLIDNALKEDYEKFRFPLLREITGNLLLYRVYGLKTLRHLFPNLAVIRGQDLFYNYALVVYEMPDLEELGLISLTTIMRGAIRLTKNKRLCYVDTIDWPRIAIGLNDSVHHIKENKDETKCPNNCPEECKNSTVDGKTAKRCWTDAHCQKSLDCSNCGSSGCINATNKCCDPSCIGGCYREGADNCVACQNIIFNNTCVSRCPPHTYMFMKRRCVTAQQCLNISRGSGKWKPHLDVIAECIDECPTGYIANENKTDCIKCNKSCPKVCVGKAVDSIHSAQLLKGCNKIEGPLEIQIMGGSNIGLELEESLGEIEEVTQYIKVVRSYALLSLNFLKNLKIIHGDLLNVNGYSLIVWDNSNLQELFTDEVTQNLKILRGSVSFHSNRKLCLDKINALVNVLNITVPEGDISKTTNGDSVPCSVTKLELEVVRIMPSLALVQYSKSEEADVRQILTYVINYREVTSDVVNIYQGRDACSESLWKTIEDPGTGDTSHYIKTLVTPLSPWTKYAIYVQAIMLKSARYRSISDVVIFTTSPTYPTSPVDLQAVAEEPGELLIMWKPPKNPNGNVTHYKVYWQVQDVNTESFDQRDYCQNPIDMSKSQKTQEESDQNKNAAKNDSQCCSCPKSNKELREEERERSIEIEFENYLHDNVYCKRQNPLPSTIDGKYTLEELADAGFTSSNSSMTKQRDRPSRTEVTLQNDRPTTTAMTTHSNISVDVNTTNARLENTYLMAVVYDTKFTLTNLGHFKEYNIEVLACQETDFKSDQLCSNRAITVARTKALDKADNINASTVEAHVQVGNNSGEVKLMWLPPSNPNGLIIKYYIEYRRANKEDHMFIKVCVSQRKYIAKGGHSLSKLEPGNYTFRIAAVSLAGNGSFTPPMYFLVPQPPTASGPKVLVSLLENCVPQPMNARTRYGECHPAVDGQINHIWVAVTIFAVLLVIVIVVIIVWFVAKNKFTKQDMTVISTNPSYMPSDELYIPDEWEVDRGKIRLIRELGQGSFGMVYEGMAKDLPGQLSEVLVAVKTVNDNAGFHEKMNFLKEATTMKAFNCNHVVKLLGVVSKGQPALVIMELMANGDLKNYLRMHRADEEDNHGLQPPTLKEIKQMAGEIADGMAYLSDKKFVHRDLAARNCMVNDQKVVKIGDFGMTRDIYETDYYRKGGKGLLPVRWMAPESLHDGVFTTMSDVWSYGVVLWEMVTLAAQPYQGLSNEEVVKFVSTDRRTMDQPDKCPDCLYELMKQCWEFNPKKRLTFKMIIEKLIPDLDPSFHKCSYFFSEENADRSRYTKMKNPHESDDEEAGVYSEDDDIDNISYAGFDAADESCIPFMTAEDPSHLHPLGMQMAQASAPHPHRSPSHSKQGASSSSCLTGAGASGCPSSLVLGVGAGSGSGSPCECVMMDELPGVNRYSPCSSPTSTNANSDGSKDSSKSSGSHSHMNGLANGHIYKAYNTRTAPC